MKANMLRSSNPCTDDAMHRHAAYLNHPGEAHEHVNEAMHRIAGTGDRAWPEGTGLSE
jgi:hypothetical protein